MPRIDANLASRATLLADAALEYQVAAALNKIKGTNGNDDLEGTDFADRIKGLGGADDIEGDDGDDKLYGGEGDDRIEGDDGNDAIFGDAGRDRIEGGDGNDKLTGGAGNDLFIFEEREGNDRIMDFERGDTILFDIDADDDGPQSFGDLVFNDTAKGVEIVYGAFDATILLVGVSEADLSPSQFVFA